MAATRAHDLPSPVLKLCSSTRLNLANNDDATSGKPPAAYGPIGVSPVMKVKLFWRRT